MSARISRPARLPCPAPADTAARSLAASIATSAPQITEDLLARVTVGIDGSPNAATALRWAAAEAVLRGAELYIVTGWQMPTAERPPGYPWTESPPLSAWQEHAQGRLEQLVAEQLPGSSAGPRRVEALHHPPVQALLEASRDADLVVVGARGLNAMQRMLLGSVSQELVHRCRIPVVIVPNQDV